ncbi:MAG: SDR family NAD(P)-dependent oxidoreductase, partial [Candidatus Binatia bacterium]
MTVTAPPYPSSHALLEGKTVLITAAAGTGIGYATARRCVEEGATVMISDIHERRLREAAAKLGEIGSSPVASMLCNVAKEQDVAALVARATDELGRIDLLINNAGLGGTANVVDMTDEQWHAVLDVTLTGTFRMMRAVLPQMIKRGSGVIVNNA